MINEQECVDLGFSCADVCKVFDRGWCLGFAQFVKSRTLRFPAEVSMLHQKLKDIKSKEDERTMEGYDKASERPIHSRGDLNLWRQR